MDTGLPECRDVARWWAGLRFDDRDHAAILEAAAPPAPPADALHHECVVAQACRHRFMGASTRP